jgi:phosphatidylserine/phosphatidylglycerophosphate/cardiolipin synthase-like enzyme
MPPTLPELESAYLLPPAPGATPPPPVLFSGNTNVVPHVDGAAYFGDISSAIEATGAGDAIYIASWLFEPRLVLAPGSLPLGRRLIEKAAAGVDVRLLLFANRFLQGLGSSDLAGDMTEGQFWVLGQLRQLVPTGSLLALLIGVVQHNIKWARDLRSRPPLAGGPPPLIDRVLLDWSGIHGHHSKCTVVKAGPDVAAFVGGIDFYPDRKDVPNHPTVPGWHDVGVRVNGAGAGGVWSDFVTRWAEASTLSPTYMRVNGALELFNPNMLISPVPPPPAIASNGIHSVHIARSYGPTKETRVLGEGVERPWATLPARGVQEIKAVLTKAIDGAKQYVYVEDQGFGGFTNARLTLYPRVADALNRGVKVIFVTSGTADPNDPQKGPINREINQVLMWYLVRKAESSKRENFTLYRVDDLTVHSKVVLIDDAFLSIGSANFWDDSMFGRACELNVMAVDAGPLVRNLRVRLWADHMRVSADDAAIAAELGDLSKSLGFWNPKWGSGLSVVKPANKLQRVWPE